MTIDDEIGLAPATSGDGGIVPEGRYTLRVVRLEKAPPSDFNPEAGPRIKWAFNLYDSKGDLFEFPQGEAYELYRHTSTKNSPRAYARQWSEALLGRPLADGEVPRLSGLVGLQMSALVSYEVSVTDSTKEVLKLSSFKHAFVDRPAPATASAAAPSRPAPDQVTVDASDEDVDRALIVSKITKSLKNLKALDAKAGAEAQAAVTASEPLAEAFLDDLRVLSDEISAAVRKVTDD